MTRSFHQNISIQENYDCEQIFLTKLLHTIPTEVCDNIQALFSMMCTELIRATTHTSAVNLIKESGFSKPHNQILSATNLRYRKQTNFTIHTNNNVGRTRRRYPSTNHRDHEEHYGMCNIDSHPDGSRKHFSVRTKLTRRSTRVDHTHPTLRNGSDRFRDKH